METPKKKMYCSEIFTTGFFICFAVGSIFVITYFSIQLNKDQNINNQYNEHMSNITNYHIVQISNQFYGFIELSFLRSTNNCSINVCNNQTEQEAKSYLQYFYPIYSNINIYYGNNQCLLSLPAETWRDVGMIVGFSVVLALCLCVGVFTFLIHYNYIDPQTSC
jgi:hypothetical protein